MPSRSRNCSRTPRSSCRPSSRTSGSMSTCERTWPVPSATIRSARAAARSETGIPVSLRRARSLAICSRRVAVARCGCQGAPSRVLSRWACPSTRAGSSRAPSRRTAPSCPARESRGPARWSSMAVIRPSPRKTSTRRPSARVASTRMVGAGGVGWVSAYSDTVFLQLFVRLTPRLTTGCGREDTDGRRASRSYLVYRIPSNGCREVFPFCDDQEYPGPTFHPAHPIWSRTHDHPPL